MTEHEEETSEEVKRPLREDSGPGLLGAAGAAAAPGSCQVRIPAAAPPSRARQPPARGRRGGDARTAPQLLQTPRAQRACDMTRTWHVPRSTEGLGGAALPAGSRAPRALPERRRPGAASRAADPGGHRTVRRLAAHTITKLHSAGTDSTACGPCSRHTERTREGARFHAKPGHSHRHGQRASPEHTHAQLGTAVCRRLARPPPTRGAVPPEAWCGCGERQARGTCSDTQHQGHATASHMARARHRGAWQTHRPVPSLSQGGGGTPGHTREGRGRTMRLPPWSGSPMLPPEVAPQPQTQVLAGSRGRTSSVWSPAPRQRSGQDN